MAAMPNPVVERALEPVGPEPTASERSQRADVAVSVETVAHSAELEDLLSSRDATVESDVRKVAPGREVEVAGAETWVSLTPSSGRSPAAPSVRAPLPVEPEPRPVVGDLVGSTLEGKYRVLRLLGSGGMGKVYLAERLTDGTHVAVKLLQVSTPFAHAALPRFAREAAVLQSLDSTRIVRPLDLAHVDRPQPFLVIEYLAGLTFKQLLSQSGPLPWRWATQAACQILEGLEVAHANGVVHRDIKPSNCFAVSDDHPLEAEPNTKLIDFGVAKLELATDPDQTLLTSSGQVVGTPAYCAPEQALGKSIDARTDLYSLGVTLYELITGDLPFVGRTAAELAMRQLSERPRPPSSVNQGMGISDELDAVLLHALQQDPARRFASATEMREVLEAILRRGSSATLSVPMGKVPARSEMEPAQSGGSSELHQLHKLATTVERFWIRGVLGHDKRGVNFPRPPRTLEQEWVGPASTGGGSLEPPPPAAVPEQTSILELFEDNAGRLLILGAPGTGKTVALLELASGLLERSHRDGKGVPLVLALGAWNGRTRSLEDWIVAEVESKYATPRSLARRWLHEGRLAVLLDGLDEVPANARLGCARAIDAFLGRYPDAQLALTSRTADYRELPLRLGLQGALCLHDLTTVNLEQLRAEEPAGSVLSELLEDAAVLELARRPTMLGLLIRIAQLDPASTQGIEFRREPVRQILDGYVSNALTRAGKVRLPVGMNLTNQIRRLAWEMQRKDLVVFDAGCLQPDWIHDGGGRWLYLVLSRMAGATLFGAALVLPFGRSPLYNMGFQTSLDFGLRLGVCTAAVGASVATAEVWLRSRLSNGNSGPALPHALRVIAIAVVTGAVTGLATGGGVHPAAVVMGVQGGMLVAPLLCSHAGAGDWARDVRLRPVVHFSLHHVLRALPWAVGTAAAAGTALATVEDVRSGIVLGVLLAVLWLAVVSVRTGNVAPKSDLSTAPSGSAKAAALRASTVTVATAPPIGLVYGWEYGACVAVGVAISMWLWFGGYAALQHAILRAVLRLEGAHFFDAKVLQAAANRGLLHRVGSGYMFLHASLREHLAEQFAARVQDPGEDTEA